MEHVKKYYAYRITNNLNGKYYIGIHKTHDPNDDYYGSGIAIKRALTKYGKENFSKQILNEFLDREEAYAAEIKLIANNWLTDPLCYNQKPGGIGGWENVDTSGDNNCMKDPAIVKKVKATRECRGSAYTPKAIAGRKRATARSAAKRLGTKDSDETKKKRNTAVKAAHQRPEVRAKYLKAMEKKRHHYRLIDPAGKEHIVENVTQFCKENNFSISTICTKDNGETCKRGSMKGWSIWKIK